MKSNWMNWRPLAAPREQSSRSSANQTNQKKFNFFYLLVACCWLLFLRRGPTTKQIHSFSSFLHKVEEIEKKLNSFDCSRPLPSPNQSPINQSTIHFFLEMKLIELMGLIGAVGCAASGGEFNCFISFPQFHSFYSHNKKKRLIFSFIVFSSFLSINKWNEVDWVACFLHKR